MNSVKYSREDIYKILRKQEETLTAKFQDKVGSLFAELRGILSQYDYKYLCSVYTGEDLVVLQTDAGEIMAVLLVKVLPGKSEAFLAVADDTVCGVGDVNPLQEYLEFGKVNLRSRFAVAWPGLRMVGTLQNEPLFDDMQANIVLYEMLSDDVALPILEQEQKVYQPPEEEEEEEIEEPVFSVTTPKPKRKQEDFSGIVSEEIKISRG